MAKIKKYLLLALTVLTLVFGCFALASCAPADGNSSSSSTGTSDTGSSDTPVADTPTEGLAYAINEDGNTASVIGIGAATNTNIIFASTYNGLPVTAIRGYAFEECYNLTSVVIPDSVTTIGEDAFDYCYSLTSVVIGDSVTTIGDWAFSECYSLTSITVNEYNQYYKSIDGNLYTKDGKTLVQYAIGKTATQFIIPDSVTTIGDDAFRYCDSLTSIVIPDSVTSIGRYAFEDCYSLTSIVIPDSVTSIGEYALQYCDSLTSVYYKGTAEEWTEIAINSNNSPLTDATRYYYSEAEPTTSGKYWHYVDGVPTAWS